MLFTKHSFSLFALASTLAWGTHAAPKWGGWGGHGGCPAKTVYISTNGASNAVVAISVGADGLLDAIASVTPTGGVGGAEINNVTTGSLAGPDSFGSQGSLQVVGDVSSNNTAHLTCSPNTNSPLQLLFVVNAGSSTLSTFKINPYNPSSLTPLSTTSTGGDFPISVAVSPALGLVCVANTGAATGVSCASFSSAGTSSFDALRPIALGQTTPTHRTPQRPSSSPLLRRQLPTPHHRQRRPDPQRHHPLLCHQLHRLLLAEIRWLHTRLRLPRRLQSPLRHHHHPGHIQTPRLRRRFRRLTPRSQQPSHAHRPD